MSSEDKCRYTNQKRRGSNLAGSEVRMAEKAKKLKIAMFGDGDIIGTTKKKRVKSMLLAA